MPTSSSYARVRRSAGTGAHGAAPPSGTPPHSVSCPPPGPHAGPPAGQQHLLLAPWTPSSQTALKAVITVRLVAALWSNISDCDEVYNYWEPAHYLVYGSGFQTWEYSPLYAIRSYAYVALHALPAYLYTTVLQPNKLLVFYFLRCLMAFVCSICEVYFYRAICKAFGIHIGRVCLCLLIFSCGMFISSTAFLPSTFAMYTNMVAMAAWYTNVPKLAIFSTALGALLGWPFVALLGLPIALDYIFFRQLWRKFIKAALMSAAVVMLPIVMIDSHYYGKMLLAPLNIVLYNIFTPHGADLYGTEPWTFYFTNGFLNFNIVFVLSLVTVPSLLILHYLNVFSINARYKLLCVSPYYLWCVVFFAQSHKEERFLFPVYPMLCLCAAVSVDCVQKLWTYVFHHSRGRYDHYLEQTNWQAMLVILISALAALSRCHALYRGYHAPVTIYGQLQEIANNQTLDSKHPINLCVGKEWYRFPSSFFLPDNWRLQFIKSDFAGQLPKPYSAPPPRGTRLTPSHMNDGNLEEASRYVTISDCDYLIDLDLPVDEKSASAYENVRFALLDTDWSVELSQPFLYPQKSHPIFRAFYIPWVSEQFTTYVNYNLLKSKNKYRVRVDSKGRSKSPQH